MRTSIKANCLNTDKCSGYSFKKQFYLSICLLATGLFLGMTGHTQIPSQCGSPGCTSNDVRVTKARISDQSGNYLDGAVSWFIDNQIPLYGIQKNPTQTTWTTSPKAYGQKIIDDAALGCPLKFDTEISNRPFVCWDSVLSHLEQIGCLNSSL